MTNHPREDGLLEWVKEQVEAARADERKMQRGSYGQGLAYGHASAFGAVAREIESRAPLLDVGEVRKEAKKLGEEEAENRLYAFFNDDEYPEAQLRLKLGVETRRAEAAESKLSSAVEELERRITNARAMNDAPWWRGVQKANEAALKLLRDKGTEGGGDGTGAGLAGDKSGPGRAQQDQATGRSRHCPPAASADSATTSKGGGDAVDVCGQGRATGKRHVARPGLEEESGPETSQGPYACPDCGRRFATLGAPCHHSDHVTFYATTVLPREAVEEGDGVAVEGDAGPGFPSRCPSCDRTEPYGQRVKYCPDPWHEDVLQQSTTGKEDCER